MDYEKQYTEDTKLTKGFLAKNFPYLKDDEDIIAMCVAGLWEKRGEYDPEKAEYSTFAFTWLRSIMNNEYHRKHYAQKRQNYCNLGLDDKGKKIKKVINKTVSIFTEVGTGITIFDGLASADNVEHQYELQYIREIAKEILAGDANMKAAVQNYLEGFSQIENAAATSLSQSQVSYLLRKFKKLCRQQILDAVGFCEKPTLL